MEKKIIEGEAVEFKVVPVLRFKEGNTIHFFQDMNFWEGVPHDVDFQIRLVDSHSVVLVADGYGLFHPNNYGNGAIHIRVKNLPESFISWYNSQGVKPAK